jgi:predicted DNA-binding protein (MmcQ/YjbR family)
VFVTTEELSDFVSALPGATEEQPFGPAVDVFKVGGKIFAILSPEEAPGSISLKCEPEWALELRDRYAAVEPGYHLNKRHWNTVTLDGSIPDEVLLSMVTHSYDRVVGGLPTALRGRWARRT